MRGGGWWLGSCAVLLGSCSPEAMFDARCSRALRMFCEHQVECGIHYDQILCEEEEAFETYCNPDATPDMFRNCFDEFDTLSDCTVSANASCLQILCDNELGCQTTTEATCQTVTPYGEPGVPCDL